MLESPAVVSEPRYGWAILGVVALGTFTTALDASIVNIGLPSITRTFRTPVGGAAEWVVIAYLVAIAATLLPFGHLSDLVGRKPVWLAMLPGVSVRAGEAAAGGMQAPAAQQANPTLSNQFLRVECSASPGRDGNSRITGYIYNQYGEAAQNVQLRISERDASGHAASSVTRPVFGTVPAEDRTYFDVQVPSSPSYQVAVQSFDFLELES